MCPAVSVVMPVFEPNRRFFAEAVRSVLDQSFEDFELIIVEDPSEQRSAPTEELVDDRIRHVVNPRRTSHAAQINDALGLARAEFVAHLDADDVCERDRLRQQLDYLRVRPYVGVLGSQLSVINATGAHRGYRRYPLDHEQILGLMPRTNPLAHSTVMYRKKLVVESGGYSDRIYPALDYELWSRLAHRGVRFANLPDALVRYRFHTEGIKRTRLRSSIRATREVKRTYWLESMTPTDRLRLWAEGVLLALPPDLVLRLFARWQFRRRPARRRSRMDARPPIEPYEATEHERGE